MQSKPDLRVVRTRNAIRSAFEDLVCEVGLDKITVSALTERAGINRKTFYLHYETIDQLFEESVSIILDDYFENYETTVEKPEDIEGHAVRFFLYISSQGELVEKLICSSNRFYYGEKVYKMQQDRYRSFCEDAPFYWSGSDMEDILCDFVRSTALNFYRNWVKAGKKIPPQEAARLLADWTCNGIQHYFDR